MFGLREKPEIENKKVSLIAKPFVELTVNYPSYNFRVFIVAFA